MNHIGENLILKINPKYLYISICNIYVFFVSNIFIYFYKFIKLYRVCTLRDKH